MHLLFATSIVPDGALASGYEIANAAIIDALRRAGARVTVLGFTWPGKPPSDPENTIVLGEVDVRTDSASPCRASSPGWRARSRRGLTFASAKLRVVSRRDVRAGDRRAPGRSTAMSSIRVQLAGAFESIFRRPALDLRRAQCRAPLGRRERRGRATAPSSACCSAARRGCSKTWKSGSAAMRASSSRWPKKTAPRSASPPTTARWRCRWSRALGACRRHGTRRDRLRRGADRHLDLAAEPHRPRLVPGQGGAASAP